MIRRVIIAGLLGGLTIACWTFVVNGFLRFNSSINMDRITDERQVYEVLKVSITEPGRYVCNPEVDRERGFPGEEPVYGIQYSGIGHGAAGGMMLLGFAIYILSAMIAAWLLSQASERVLASYWRKVLFFTLIGVLFALFENLQEYGIAGYSLSDTLLLAGHNIVLWTFIGLVVAWRIKPIPSAGQVNAA